MSETVNTVEATHELDHLANRIRVQLEKSDNLYISAGELLKEARTKCKEHGLKWASWLKEHNIGKSKAAVCLAIADGRKTIDEVRKENAERQAKHQAKNRKARNGEEGEGEGDVDPPEDDMTPEHAAMIKALTKFVKVASPDVLAKLCKVAKIKIEAI
jgi:hypothetical protein